MCQIIASLKGETKPLALSASFLISIGRDNLKKPTLVFEKSRERRSSYEGRGRLGARSNWGRAVEVTPTKLSNLNK